MAARVLVVWYGDEGQTAKIAELIATGPTGRGATVSLIEETPPGTP